jgi:Na+/melibiose symporter-like transporter
MLTLPFAMINMPVAAYLPAFYTQDLGLSLATVGFIVMAARISDIITDPLVGMLSDRLHFRFGRRRPWIIMGLPIMMLSTYMLFLPTPPVGSLYLLVWIALLYLGWTFMAIPYQAWGAELSSNYHERSRVTAARQLFQVTGMFLAGGIPVLAARSGEGNTPIMSALGIVIVVLLPLCVLLLITTVAEPSPVEVQRINWKRGLTIALRNGPFWRLLFATFLSMVGVSISIPLAMLFYTHVLDLGDKAPLLIMVLFSSSMVAIPVWIKISRSVSKHRVSIMATFWGCFFFAMIAFLEPGDFYPLLVISILGGLSLSAAPIMSASMMADVIDLDNLRSGEQRSAFYFSLFGMCMKLGFALGVGIGFPLLQFFGFDPNGTNEPSALFALTMLYCIVPVVFYLLSVVTIWNFPITPERQARLRILIERRNTRLRKQHHDCKRHF